MVMPTVGKPPLLVETIHLWLRIIICPLRAGDHTIELEETRKPQSDQPLEHDVAKWDIKVVP
jgi:hypothetical protein